MFHCGCQLNNVDLGKKNTFEGSADIIEILLYNTIVDAMQMRRLLAISAWPLVSLSIGHDFRARRMT